MLGIRLLGSFELILPDGSQPGRLGPKAKALLAFLAMNRGSAVPRGRLAGLLWGEREEALARHSLNQALSTIRAALGPTAADMLKTCPEGLLLARESLELDIEAFEGATRGDDRAGPEEACRLYRGEFLATLDLREPGFEEWMLTERYRLAGLAAGAFARLVDLQAAAGEIDAAVEAARKLVALTPLDETAHARLIQLYGAQGRRGLVEAHYTRCSELVQRELGQAPGVELRAAQADARRRAPGKSDGDNPGQSRPQPGNLDERPRRTVPSPRIRWATAVGTTAAMLIGGLAWLMHEQSTGEAVTAAAYQTAPWDLPARPSIAVMPFVNLSQDREQEYFVDGMTSDITTNLAKFPTLFVTAADASFRFKGEAATVSDVARDLGVRYVLEGSAQTIADTLRVNVNLDRRHDRPARLGRALRTAEPERF